MLHNKRSHRNEKPLHHNKEQPWLVISRESPGAAMNIQSSQKINTSFSSGSDGKASCLQCGRPGFNPWIRKIPWRRKWQPTPALLPGKSHGQRSVVGYSSRGRKESDTTERLPFHFHFLKNALTRLTPDKTQKAHWHIQITKHIKGKLIMPYGILHSPLSDSGFTYRTTTITTNVAWLLHAWKHLV